MRGFIPRLLLCGLVFLALGAVGARAAPAFPPLTGRVVDDAGILSPQTQDRLNALLAQEEKQTGNQIVVATLKSLQGYTIEQYGYQLGRAWGIGQKGKNNGALMIVVPSTHDVRIEVGYGLEGELTDAQSKIIIDQFMLPAFRRGDYDAGVLAGTEAIIKVYGGVQFAPSDENQSGTDQGQGGGHGGTPWMFIVIILIWLVFGRFLWPLLFLGGSSGGFAGGGFGGGGFGGGFSGGGGSFGGGGASGHW